MFSRIHLNTPRACQFSRQMRSWMVQLWRTWLWGAVGCWAVLPLISVNLLAEDKACERDCVDIGKWQFGVALGVGMRTNPILDESDTPLLVLPQVQYYGERFFIENFDLGFTLVSTDQQQLHLLLFTPSMDHGFFNRFSVSNFTLEGAASFTVDTPVNRDPTIANVPNTESVSADVNFNFSQRRFSAFGGLEYQYALGTAQLQLQALADVTGVHKGQELRVAVAYPFFVGSHQFGLALGALHQSAAVTQYYYGVNESEVNDPVFAYQPTSGLSKFVRVNWSKPISARWRWQGSVQYRLFPSTITDSPIVVDSGVATVFIGGVYHF